MTANNLEGLNALITGASGGIGSAIAISFAERGINLALQYSTQKPERLLSSIRERFPQVKVKLFQADISTTPSCTSLGSQVLSFFENRCDIFISNAGIARFAVDSKSYPCAATLTLLTLQYGIPL